jgi:aminoglycoside phosphotransferase (APT) family kinase protein
MLALRGVSAGPDSPKPHPRHAWLPAFLPADARSVRTDDGELARALADSGAEVPHAGDVDVEIVDSPAALSGAATAAIVRLDRRGSDVGGATAIRVVRRVAHMLRLFASIRRARRALAARGYGELHVATWDRPRSPHLRLPGGRRARRPLALASLAPRNAVVAGYRPPRSRTCLEAAASAAAAYGEVPELGSALVAGSGMLLMAGEGTVLRTAVGPAVGLIEAERTALAALGRSSPPPFVSARVPRPLGGGAHGLAAWSLESRVAGTTTAPPYPQEFLDDCIEFLAGLTSSSGEGSARSLSADATVIARCCPPEQADALAQIARDVEAAIAELPRGLGHGDFAGGNLLATRGRLTGVVDWAKGGPGRLPLLDLLHLRVNIEASRTGLHLGEVVARFLVPWARAGGDELLRRFYERTGLVLEAEQLEAATIAYWIDFIGSELDSYADRARRPVWVEKNVAMVVRSLLAPS